MDLAQRDKGPLLFPAHCPNSLEKSLPVTLDISSPVAFRESEIQSITAI